MKGLKTVAAALAVMCAVSLCGCEENEDIFPAELTTGYWKETVSNGMFLRFDGAHNVFSYIYVYNDEEEAYYIYPDPAWEGNGEYLMDSDNDWLYIDPGRWFEILRLTSQEMKLRENGEESRTITFVKLSGDNIVTPSQ